MVLKTDIITALEANNNLLAFSNSTLTEYRAGYQKLQSSQIFIAMPLFLRELWRNVH